MGLGQGGPTNWKEKSELGKEEEGGVPGRGNGEFKGSAPGESLSELGVGRAVALSCRSH